LVSLGQSIKMIGVRNEKGPESFGPARGVVPTVITHALVPLTVAIVAGSKRIPPRVAVTGLLLAMLPDLDVIGFRFGISYDAAWGHRGAMHSLAIGAIVVFGMAALVPALRKGWIMAFLLLAITSHGLLDTLTDGGRGVALLWPFDSARYFAAWRPIRVSPIGARFFTSRGMVTAVSELQWIWLPCLAVAVSALTACRFHRSRIPAMIAG
jgi:inner membrane protein